MYVAEASKGILNQVPYDRDYQNVHSETHNVVEVDLYHSLNSLQDNDLRLQLNPLQGNL